MSTTTAELKLWEIVLPRELQEFVEEELKSKRFRDAHQLIAVALYRFRDIAAAERIKYERLKADLQVGIGQLERGEVVDGEEMFERLHRKLDDAEANGG